MPMCRSLQKKTRHNVPGIYVGGLAWKREASQGLRCVEGVVQKANVFGTGA